MSKLGLCVRYDCDNFGSMLQIFATEKVIEKYSWEYEIIRYDKKTTAFILRNLTRIFNPYFVKGKFMALSKKIGLKKYPEVDEENTIRIKAIGKYREKYIGPYSPVYKGYSSLVSGTKSYDAIMVGSDQLWTPAGIKSYFYNLLFVPDNVRKISFATSFGVKEVPASQMALTKEYLNRIDFLSVRELSGAALVKALTDRDCVVALDPTLLFTREEWEQFFPVKQIITERYIFAYFLGESESHRDLVEELSKETGCKIVTCPFMDAFVERDLTFGNIKLFHVDPVDFLNLIREAEFICTDSFHGSVFSILNHKKFLTFDRYSDSIRKSKNTRIDSLFNQLGIEDRHYKNTGSLSTIKNSINYELIDLKLQKLRKKTNDFLCEALKR